MHHSSLDWKNKKKFTFDLKNLLKSFNVNLVLSETFDILFWSFNSKSVPLKKLFALFAACKL